MRDGLCHLAGSHLLDPATGEYTLPYLDRVLGAGEGAVVRLVHRQQGLLVAPGNPLGLAGIADLTRPGLRYVNRQRGAGTRVLLDHELARPGVDPVDVEGYGREESTHLAVARRGRRPAGPTPAWASWPPPARSASTSCRWPRSPTTWSPRAGHARRPVSSTRCST